MFTKYGTIFTGKYKQNTNKLHEAFFYWLSLMQMCSD